MGMMDFDVGRVGLACGGGAGFGCLVTRATTRVRPYGGVVTRVASLGSYRRGAGLDDWIRPLFQLCPRCQTVARRLALRMVAKSVFGLPPSLGCSRAGAVAAPSWRVRADVCRIHERSSNPWASVQPRPGRPQGFAPTVRATTRVAPTGVLTSGSFCGACLGVATGPCSSVRF